MVERKEYLDQLWAWKDERQIKVVTGIRRCGKSVLLEQYQQRLLANGVAPEQIISINFENLDYEPLKDYMRLYNYLKERLCVDKMTYIFLDEVQEVPSFEKVVDSLYIRDHVDVYITGSNAYMLSSELATLLSGRYTEIKMLPLSFREYIAVTTYIFSDTNKDKKANNASGPFATYNKKPVLFLYDKDTAEDLIIQRFKEECTACDISVSPDKVAIVTRSKIHSDDSIDNLWKTPETELLARASFEWMCDNRKKAYVFCERALFQMVVKDLKDIDVSIEWDVSQIIQYAKWKQVVIEILIRLPSADEECGQWVTNSRDIVHKILVSHNVAMRDGITMNDAIKIKTRDKKHPDFRKIPIRCYFEIKSKAEYTYSSIHGVKGETFDALMLLIHGTVGNTLTPSFLANGKTNTELMRIAYVAMTRPRKLLVVAMPKNKAKLSNRFPPDKWDYVEL